MHPIMLSQLVDDRKDELAADAKRAHRARQQLRRSPRVAAADETPSRREWRALLRIFQLAR
jgi:hypothetical protein